VGVLSVLKAIKDFVIIDDGDFKEGPWVPVTDRRDGEPFDDYLRRKHGEDVGGSSGRHSVLEGMAYVKDRHGNLIPCKPRERSRARDPVSPRGGLGGR
jgi:hypothetical protein